MEISIQDNKRLENDLYFQNFRLKILIEQANETFGIDMVHRVREKVWETNPDDAFSFFDRIGKDDEAECVRFIYFEKQLNF
jgi:hypothetical protein